MQGEAELRIFNFKTIWSEFQKPSQTAATRGEAELNILDFKTTWSEFQNHRRTTTMHRQPCMLLLHATAIATAAAAAATKITSFLGKAKPSYVYSTQFRVSSPLQSRSKAVVCASTPRKYPRSGYFLVTYI